MDEEHQGISDLGIFTRHPDVCFSKHLGSHETSWNMKQLSSWSCFFYIKSFWNSTFFGLWDGFFFGEKNPSRKAAVLWEPPNAHVGRLQHGAIGVHLLTSTARFWLPFFFDVWKKLQGWDWPKLNLPPQTGKNGDPPFFFQKKKHHFFF